ncbi:MAG: surface layer protein [Oscillibacter sp.]|uniref:phosphodiester glycosidase family protein n=1 Tax=Oscillibacter sp. TaxID=1945593 RepID=UPI002173D9AF|nr:phosphodiester glycosidase family protein [Oscillibacter sp.]MCI9113839.1 surface layer protein [Oscillibacter sp.]MCI9461672.1 surface layer protein [Oscillibacter sp.]
MKRIFPRALSLLLALSLLAALTVSPALASEAMGDDLTATDTLLNRETQLSTNVFWSTISSDYRTENLITYTPNASVTPIVTYGGALTDRSSVSNTAKALEEQGYRVVAGINGDFYNVNNGLPIGVVVTQGRLRSSDGGYHAIGFRSDGTAILGKPAITMSVRYTTQDGAGEPLYNEAGEPLYDELGNPLTSGTGQAAEKTLWPAALNKARTESGVYLYTYDFNASHTTGATQPGVDVVCTIQEGNLALGGTTFLKVERIAETEKEPTPLGPTHVVLSANAKAGEETLNALRSIPVGTVLTLALTPADPGWNDVQYAAGALYSLVENGAAASGLPTGAAPRTAVGQRYDGSLVFYTIDGRKSGHSIGATMDQVARRLIELGCVTALGLDGGGSTTLAVTKPTDTAAERINQPSDRVERSVSNQIFLVASNQPTGQLSHFYVSADNAYVLAGSSAEISAAAVDTNFIPMNERYDLTASAGTLSGNILTTPLEGGDITVTAQGGGGQGSTVVHAVTAPDGLAVRNADNAIITELSASPGTAVQLHGSAAYKHLPLKADPAAFTWALEGDIGTIDETGLFTATALGTGKITVSAGTQSASIDVTVSTQHLETLEDFEGETTIFRGSGEGASFSLNRDGNYVRFGKASGKLDYDLTANAAGGTARWNATAQPAVLNAPYTGLNLWVDSNGSGNTLSLLYGTGEEETQVLPLTTLDVSGWKQVSVNDLPAGITIRGLEISGTGAGTIYLDQVVATFDGTVDSAAPVITAELDPESRIITGSITDGVDGILPAERISISSGGEYEPATGRFTVTLPAAGAGQGISRVTIRAKDYSGNIGRASVDLPASGGERRFTDTAEYWGADYCDFLYNQGISGGYDDGTFRPDDLLTRLDFSVMLYNALRLDPAKYAEVALPFADLEKLPEGALPAVRALYAEGVVTGTQGKDGKLYFNPAGNLTRAQASAMIGRSQEKGYALAELTFTDAAQIPGYASFYIRTMVSQGILSGYDDGTFRPQANITRGQMAKILYTML